MTESSMPAVCSTAASGQLEVDRACVPAGATPTQPPPQALPLPSNRPCPTCGSDMPATAVWCASCKLYQQDADASPKAARTRRCDHCGTYVPAHASKCYACSGRIGRWGAVDMSVGTVSAVTALFSTAIALLLTITAFIDKHTSNVANVQIAYESITPSQPAINVTATNNGKRAGVLSQFKLGVSLTLGTNSQSYEFVEILSVDDRAKLSLSVPAGADAQQIVLKPYGPSSHWDLRNSFKSKNPLISDNQLQTALDDFPGFLRAAQATCTLHYERQTPQGPDSRTMPVATAAECAEFIRGAYNL